MRVGVVYYSRTGNTAEAASKLASLLEADIIRIEDLENRNGVIGFLRSAYEAVAGKNAAIAETDVDLSVYDLVVLCTPVWAGKMSSPARAFLSMYGKSLRSVAYLLTRADPKNDYLKICNTMDALTGKKHIAALSLKGGRDVGRKELEEFAAFLKAQ